MTAPPHAAAPVATPAARVWSRNYRLFVLGLVVSTVGTWAQHGARSWLVLDISGNSGAALGSLQFLPEPDRGDRHDPQPGPDVGLLEAASAAVGSVGDHRRRGGLRRGQRPHAGGALRRQVRHRLGRAHTRYLQQQLDKLG